RRPAAARRGAPLSDTLAARARATALPPPLSLHDALPISVPDRVRPRAARAPLEIPVGDDVHAPPPRRGGVGLLPRSTALGGDGRSEEHTSELQSRENLVCRLLLEKKQGGQGQRHDRGPRR